ncbi:ABC transporter, solute-binding protein [Paenibacillus sp. oral taxon 786 str. D14]|nr:ABC transporter, solute-binding protein [Paenibacillus sp. oral taxon 786 str. D14]
MGGLLLKKSSKWISVLALSIVVALIGSACASNNGNNTSASKTNESGSTNTGSKTFTLGQDELTYTFYGNYDWFTPPGEWGKDRTSKWILDNKKVTMNVVTSDGAAAQKLNTMIASSSLPDVIWTDKFGTDYERLRAADQLVPLDDYLDKYPNLKRLIGEETLNMLRAPDGKIYQIPNWYSNKPLGNAGWMINNKIYKELGSPTLETFDDLYNYLKLVKENYPDVTPLDLNKGAEGNIFMYSGFAEGRLPTYVEQRAYIEDNTFKSIYKDPVYIETVKYINKLVNEKLISQDLLTQKEDQIKEKLNTGRIAVLVAYDVTEPSNSAELEWKKTDPEADYEVIWPIHKAGLDKTKIINNPYSTLGWNASLITRNAKDPEAIFAFYDWMAGEEGQNVLCFGPPGWLWDEVDEENSPIPNENWAATSDQEKTDAKLFDWNYVGNTSHVDGSKAKIEMTLPKEKQNQTAVAQMNVTWKTTQDTTELNGITPPSDSTEGIIAQRVGDIYNETFGKILFASSEAEIDKLLESGYEQSMKVGHQKLMDYLQKNWEENKKKLGK